MSNGTHWFGQVASQSVDCGVFEDLESFTKKVVCNIVCGTKAQASSGFYVPHVWIRGTVEASVK